MSSICDDGYDCAFNVPDSLMARKTDATSGLSSKKVNEYA